VIHFTSYYPYVYENFQIWGNSYSIGDANRFNYSAGTLLWEEQAYSVNGTNLSLYSAHVPIGGQNFRQLLGFNPSNTSFKCYSLVVYRMISGNVMNEFCGVGFVPLQMSSTTANRYVPTTFTLTTNSSNGYPLITKVVASKTIMGKINIGNLCTYELFRRVFPVVRDKNTIVLTDGNGLITHQFMLVLLYYNRDISNCHYQR